MKFCKVLEGQDKDIPEFKHIVLRYKQLKKKIKAIPKAAPNADGQAEHQQAAEAAGAEQQTETLLLVPEAATCEPSQAAGLSKSAAALDESPASNPGSGVLSVEEQDFMYTLNEDVNRFNSFFMEKEEDAVIKLQSIEEQLQAATDTEQLNEIRSRLVNFHGELVMVLHWSLINYSAIVKILKKHDKRSGVLLRAPYLANVLTQPFSSTNVMSRLVKRCEELVAAAVEHQLPRKRAKVTPATEEVASREAGVQPVLRAQIASAGLGLGFSGQRLQEGGAEREQERERKVLNDSSDDEGSSLTEVSNDEPVIRRTKLALEMWQTLAKSASTPSTILNPEGSAAPTPAIHCNDAPHSVLTPHEALGLDSHAGSGVAVADGQALSSCAAAGVAACGAPVPAGQRVRVGAKRVSDEACGRLAGPA